MTIFVSFLFGFKADFGSLLLDFYVIGENICTMVQNSLMFYHLIIQFPMSLGVSEWVSE